MSDFALNCLMAMSQPPAGTEANPTGELLKMLMTLAFFMVVMYLIMIRPQQKKAKEHRAMLDTLKPGDKVLTSGGVLAVVVSVKEKTVSLRSLESKFEVLKSAVTEITERSS